MTRPTPALWLVLALLVVAALLISVPALRAPTAGDVCNAGSFEVRDDLEAEKESAAIGVLLGALASLAAAIVAFFSAQSRRGRAKLSLRLLGVLALLGLGAGLLVAFLTAMIVC